MSTPQYNPNDIPKHISGNQHLPDNERLDQLEKEVCCLRCDFDKIKSEHAIMKTAMGRAIIRDSALSDLKSSQRPNSQDEKSLIPDNCPITSENISKTVKCQFANEKLHSSNVSPPAPTPEKLKKNEKQDGEYFTLG